jgi:hypothetical protein
VEVARARGFTYGCSQLHHNPLFTSSLHSEVAKESIPFRARVSWRECVWQEEPDAFRQGCLFESAERRRLEIRLIPEFVSTFFTEVFIFYLLRSDVISWKSRLEIGSTDLSPASSESRARSAAPSRGARTSRRLPL